jgi:HK97 family phage prohead protease
MQQRLEVCRVPFDGALKFESDGEVGEISGYGSTFNVTDLNGDMMMPGAFDATLAEHKSSGRVMPMFGEHSFAFLGGDPYPIGGWTKLEPDTKGLHVTGKLVGLKHPDVARVYELVKEKLISAMSIAYRVRDGGYEKGTKAGDPRRWLKAVDLFSIDLVGDPANPQATIDNIKSVLTLPNHQRAASWIKEAFSLCGESLGGGNAPTKAQRDQLNGYLQDAHRELTGEEIPALMRFEQLREFKKWLHSPVDQGGRGFTNSQADELATLIFKSMPRDEDGDAAKARKEAVGDIARALSGFSLKFGT